MNVQLTREILDRCNEAEMLSHLDAYYGVNAQFPQQGQGYAYQHPSPDAQKIVPHQNVSGQYLPPSQPQPVYCPGPPHHSDEQYQSLYRFELTDIPQKTQTSQSRKPQKLQRFVKPNSPCPTTCTAPIMTPLTHPISAYAVNTRHDGSMPDGKVCSTIVR